MKKLLTFILILCTATLFAEMRGGSQYDPGAVRSNLTNITSGSALGIANGGTGKTTAAEALAALGGASLNGSSTVDFYGKDIFAQDPTGAKIDIGLTTATNTLNFIAIRGMNAGSYFIGKRSSIGSASLVIAYGSGPETSSGLMLGVNNIFYIGTCPTHADNAAAIAGGLTAGQVYRTSTGVLMIVYTP